MLQVENKEYRPSSCYHLLYQIISCYNLCVRNLYLLGSYIVFEQLMLQSIVKLSTSLLLILHVVFHNGKKKLMWFCRYIRK